jgi:hypothetical protein
VGAEQKLLSNGAGNKLSSSKIKRLAARARPQKPSFRD